MKNTLNGPSVDLNIVFMKGWTVLLSYWEIENSIFFKYFFNISISVTINLIHFKSVYIILNICMEGTVSQNFDTTQPFRFMKCRKLNLRKMQKVFCQKKLKLGNSK